MDATAERRSGPPMLPLLCAGGFVLVLAVPRGSAHPVVAAAVFALLVVAAASVGWRLASRWLPDAPASVFLAGAALGTEAIAATLVVVPGSLRAFGLPAVLGALSALTFLTRRCLPDRSLASVLAGLPFGRGTSAAAVAVLLAVGVVVAHGVRTQILYTVQDADSMWYHLVMVGEWVRSGTLAPIEAIPQIGIGYPGFRQALLAYLSLPHGTEHLALLGGFESPLLALATYALSRDHGAARPIALGAGLAAATTPVALAALGTQGNDVCLAIHLVLSLLFLGRWLGAGGRGDGWLAGLALGALAATKFSGPGYAGLVVAVVVGSHGLRTAWRRGAAWTAVAAAAALLAGPWYLRNLLAFGNPLYPARVQVGDAVLFAGPLGREWFEQSTVGWRIGPLVEHAGRFVAAHGWLCLLAAAAPLLALVAGWRRIVPFRRAIGLALLPVLLFVAFLHHPFNHPLHDAEISQRYLTAWFAASMAVAAIGLTAIGAQLPWVLLCLASTFAALRTVTHMALPAAVGVAVGTAALSVAAVRRPVAAACARAMSWRVPVVAALVALAAAAFVVERFRVREQYDPATGYHDAASERGWGPVAAWVHRHVGGARVGLHGSIFLFPLLGEPFSNRLFLADDLYLPGRKSLDELAAWARENRLDWLVCCVPRTDRVSTREFVFGDAVTARLVARFPRLFTVAFEKDGAAVLQVHLDEGR